MPQNLGMSFLVIYSQQMIILGWNYLSIPVCFMHSKSWDIVPEQSQKT